MRVDYCDACGQVVGDDGKTLMDNWWQPFSSMPKPQSASLCPTCHSMIWSRATWWKETQGKKKAAP